MMEYHSRPRVAHDHPDALAHVGLVAMHATVVAECFALDEGAMIRPALRIINQLGALRTQLTALRPVVAVAVYRDHLLDYALFLLAFLLYLVHRFRSTCHI